MRLFIVLVLLLCAGCAGVGLEKKATLIPDEVWVTGDIGRDRADKATVGVKWKLE